MTRRSSGAGVAAAPPAQLQPAGLEQRIAQAFTNGTRSTKVVTLIQQVEAATGRANEAATRARERALDPISMAAGSD